MEQPGSRTFAKSPTFGKRVLPNAPPKDNPADKRQQDRGDEDDGQDCRAAFINLRRSTTGIIMVDKNIEAIR